MKVNTCHSYSLGIVGSPMILVVILAAFHAASALECGKQWTKPCIGASDSRYDPKASNSLKDQSNTWGRQEGYFLFDQFFYSDDGQPIYFSSVQDGLIVKNFPTVGFSNLTVDGSRLYQHRYNIFPGFQPGVPGVATVSDSWETSSYEKDGRSISRGGLVGFATDATRLKDVAVSISYPVDSRTLYSSGFTKGGVFEPEDTFLTETSVCLNEECSEITATQDQFIYFNGTTSRTKFSVLHMTRVTEEAWIEAVNNAMEAYNVTDAFRVEIPQKGACLSGGCNISEEWWCMTDPNCSQSPYEEPPASLVDGAIVVIIIVCCMVLLAGFHFVHKFLSRRQQHHFRTQFAKRVADQMFIGASVHSLSPEQLAKEFKHIDGKTCDGMISLEDLRDFMASGKMGEISTSDVNALFSAMDLDGSGTVDFLEFCSFIAKCDHEFDALIAQDRHHVADLSARRLSSRVSSSIGLDAQKVVDEVEAYCCSSEDSGNP